MAIDESRVRFGHNGRPQPAGRQAGRRAVGCPTSSTSNSETVTRPCPRTFRVQVPAEVHPPKGPHPKRPSSGSARERPRLLRVRGRFGAGIFGRLLGSGAGAGVFGILSGLRALMTTTGSLRGAPSPLCMWWVWEEEPQAYGRASCRDLGCLVRVGGWGGDIAGSVRRWRPTCLHGSSSEPGPSSGATMATDGSARTRPIFSS